MRVRHSRPAVLLLGLGVFAAACGGGGQQGGDEGEQAAGGGEFSAEICEPESLIPQNTNEVCGSEVLGALFSRLIDYAPKTSEPLMGDDAPRAHAASVSSTDQQTWTIKLKPGWTFHDGTPVTAQSYVDAWNFGAYQPNAYDNSYFFANIEGYQDLQCPTDAQGKCAGDPPAKEMTGLRAVDAGTIEVTLSEPFSQFPITLGYNSFYPLPKAFFDDPKAFNEAPIGDGPFKMDGRWKHNQSIRVVRYEDFAGKPANTDAVEFRIYESLDTAYNDLRAGNLDVQENLPRGQIAAAKQEFGDGYFESPSSQWTYIGFPLYDRRFGNPDLRKAFSMAIDRKAITDTIRVDSVPADAYVSPVVAGYRPGACGEPCEYNPQQARQLLQKAGGWEGELVLWFNSDGDHATWMEAVANQLRQNLGIRQIRFESMIFAQYNQLLDDNKVTGPFRLGWVMDYPSMQNYLEQIFATGASSNRTRYANPRFDELIAKGNAAGSVEEGITFYQQAEDLLVQDVPAISMFFSRNTSAHGPRVSGVAIDALDRMNTADVVVNDAGG